MDGGGVGCERTGSCLMSSEHDVKSCGGGMKVNDERRPAFSRTSLSWAFSAIRSLFCCSRSAC